MSKKNLFLLLVVVTILLLALSNIPLLYGWLHHVPGRKFMGIVAGVRDANFYFMMMEQADSWRLFLQNKFAAGEPNIIYHGFFWIPLGLLGHLFSGGFLSVYHGARIAATILFVPVAWYFVSRFLESTAERVAGLLIICFGAGAGWLQLAHYYRTGVMPFAPADIATPEATSFFTLMTFPHLSVALILIALSFALIQQSVSKNAILPALAAGVCGLILGFIHVVNLVVILAVLAAYAGISLLILKEKMPLRAAISFGAVAIWPVAYYVYLSLVYPDLLPQAPVRSPEPAVYLVGFAPLLILALFSVVPLARKRKVPASVLLLLCWVVINSLMLYSYPLIKQEARTVLGLQLPLAILASRGIFRAVLPALGLTGAEAQKKGGNAAAIAVAGAVVVFTFPSSFYNIIERVSRLKAYPEAFSLTNDEYEALRFLHNESGGGIVLAGDTVGSYIPRETGKCSWLGQYDLPSHDYRLQMTRDFFANGLSDYQREKFLGDRGIKFIFYGREERAMGGFAPDETPYLEELFQNESVAVYHVEDEAARDNQ